MSQQLINRSPDLWQLRDEGYDIEARSGWLIVRDVPYVNSRREVRRGIIAAELTLTGDVTTTPRDHTVWFAGDPPCRADGTEINIRASNGPHTIDRDLVFDHYLSRKPVGEPYRDFHHKIETYVGIISGPTQVLDPKVTAQTFPIVEAKEEESVFNYIDTASSRAGINIITQKLEIGRIAIIRLGGTWSYVLDFVAKTPVKEIHLFDGDKLSHIMPFDLLVLPLWMS